jgi:protease IV
MNFAKTAWKLIVAIKDLMVLLLLLGFFGLVYVAIRDARAVEHVPTSGALFLGLRGPIVEQPTPINRLAGLTGESAGTEYRLRDVVRAIETAASDRAIKAVVLDLDGFGGGGQVAMERVGAALDKVRKAGKPVLAHSILYDDDAYMLAAHASEVWLAPLGMVGVTGPSGRNLYYKGLIEKVGAKVHVYRAGTYKSAVEPYTRADQSTESRAADAALLADIWEDWLANVGKARPKAKIVPYLGDLVGALKAANGDTAKAALNAGLVDRLGDAVTFGKRVAELAGAPDDGGPGSFSAVPLQSYLRHHRPGDGGAVGVITVAGEIVDGETQPGTAGGFTVSGLIRDALADEAVEALVLRVDSPGGSVTASEEIRAALLEAKDMGLPIVVSMGNVAASGGYWVATPADAIYAEPATITGSIGAYGIVPSFEATLAKFGITSDGVQATPYSGQPDIIGGVSPEFDALGQMTIDDVYRRFVGLVAASRKLSPARVDEIGQGRVWAGGAARQLKLIDRFGGLEEAIADAAKRANLSGTQAAARYFDPRDRSLDRLFSVLQGDEEEVAIGARASAPRDWLSLAALRQRQWAARIVADLRALADGPALRIDCLECRGFDAPRTPAGAHAGGWLETLARIVAAEAR